MWCQTHALTRTSTPAAKMEDTCEAVPVRHRTQGVPVFANGELLQRLWQRSQTDRATHSTLELVCKRPTLCEASGTRGKGSTKSP